MAREKRAGELVLIGAWYGAAFQRQRRLPSLKSLLTPAVTRTLTPEQAALRKAEFQELSKLSQQLSQRMKVGKQHD